ncbi:MAG: guanylate kinase [Bacteroidota bacterium]
MHQKKLIIFSGPSGSGKTTIVQHLLNLYPDKLGFSISATTREKRGVEKNGKDYYYLSMEEFKQKINEDAFLEWEEVYSGRYYGTLKSEANRIWQSGKSVLFDIDVEGGLNMKHQFPKTSIAIFVMPPSIKILEERLKSRKTDSPESVARRIEKAEKELKTARLFDKFIINENLEMALNQANDIVLDFLKDH